MKKLVFLISILLFIGIGSAFAQRGGGGGRAGGGMGSGPQSGGASQRTGNPNAQQGQRPDGMGQRGQNGQRPEGAGNGQNPKQMLKGLDLSNEQKNQVKQILKDAKANNTDPKTVHEQIKAILTPEQIEKFKQRRAKQSNEQTNP